jgi:hypothetical protein
LRLSESPGLEAKTLFEMLQELRPGAYGDGQVRTLQRRVKEWRATQGPDKEVFFAQEHRPGEAAQTDFTHGTELGVAIGGVAFVHLLCHFVLPYSNWEWVTVCLSESLLALRRGVQAALFRLGKPFASRAISRPTTPALAASRSAAAEWATSCSTASTQRVLG